MDEAVIEWTLDKFTFRLPKDFYYHATGVWVRPEGRLARLGLSDFAQQRSGDVAFVDVQPQGTRLAFEDELACIETIKVTIALPSPVSGEIVQVNAALNDEPERVNQDPYGEGWLVVVALEDWARDQARLLDAEAYRVLIEEQAREDGQEE